ncbi:hypothetical protein Lalb_Chr12g0196061 [Lupinus albus]|uniref:Uncharacterized protein n=1 Tax=Lupinus albus TaxID=3870 RepID=A0A6A4PKY5_LUPAL|nr:hypothetical protein Lalb_Chr12g0196061 [Lupinus albus]
MGPDILQDLPSFHSLRIPRICSSAEEVNEYTSLKDIIYNTPTKYSSIYEGNDFDSTINIRNELVKRAASVYLQSTALLVTRNPNCFITFWERVRTNAASSSCWTLCFSPLFRFLNRMLRRLRSLP